MQWHGLNRWPPNMAPNLRSWSLIPANVLRTPPEWVSQAQSIGEAQSASALEAEKSNQQPERVENALNIGEQFFAEFESASYSRACN